LSITLPGYYEHFLKMPIDMKAMIVDKCKEGSKVQPSGLRFDIYDSIFAFVIL
jgi:hypothetical protein